MSHKVIDYSFARFSAQQLHDMGAVAVCRYLTVVTPQTKGKLLTRGEADGLSAGGLGIASTFEFQEHDALGGYQKGKEYAALALEQPAAAGGPAGLLIYFGVDFDTTDYPAKLPNTPGNARAKLGAIANYFHGINDILGGPHLTGAYGGYWVIKRLFEAGLIGLGWQTAAWSAAAVPARGAVPARLLRSVRRQRRRSQRLRPVARRLAARRPPGRRRDPGAGHGPGLAQGEAR